MTEVVDQVEPSVRSNAQQHVADPAEQLRQSTTACRVSFTWLGVRKTLSPAQKAQAAEPFGAEAAFLSAAKRLLDTRHPAYRAVTRVRGEVRKYWQSVSLPFPEPGIRLVRQGDVEQIHRRMEAFRRQLERAVDRLEHWYAYLKEQARQRLGRLYQPEDYPPSLVGLFDLAWDFPSVEPPPYLAQLAPEVYRQQCRRVQARFDEAVHLAEQAFTEELRKLVAHLVDRLTPGADGQAKVFRDSAVESFAEFFRRFRRLNIRSNTELERLVAQAEQILSGVRPQLLRENGNLRAEVARNMAQVESLLDRWLVDRPRRRILRTPR